MIDSSQKRIDEMWQTLELYDDSVYNANEKLYDLLRIFINEFVYIHRKLVDLEERIESLEEEVKE